MVEAVPIVTELLKTLSMKQDETEIAGIKIDQKKRDWMRTLGFIFSIISLVIAILSLIINLSK